MAAEQRRECRGFAREAPAQLHAFETELRDLAQDVVQRRVAAQFGHVVVGPCDRTDAEADAHGRFRLRGTPASQAWRAMLTSVLSETPRTATSPPPPPAPVVPRGP